MEIRKPLSPFRTPSCICYVCKKKQSKYICPKCSVPYCSLTCYKGHSEECTEGFYKEQVTQMLKSQKADKRKKEDMLQMLKRTDDMPDMVLEDLQADIESERMESLLKIVEAGKDCLDLLTEAEKNEFLGFISSGKVLKYVQEWVPWWINENDCCIEVCSDQSYISLPSIEKLCKNPSPFLLFYIFEVVWTAVYAWRTVNGDVQENQEEIIRTLMQISLVFNSGKCDFQRFSDIFPGLTERVLKPDPEIAHGLIPSVQLDCTFLFASKWKLIKFLLELLHFIQTLNPSKFHSQAKNSLFTLHKKLEFFLSFLKTAEIIQFSQDFNTYLSQAANI